MPIRGDDLPRPLSNAGGCLSRKTAWTIAAYASIAFLWFMGVVRTATSNMHVADDVHPVDRPQSRSRST
jgi:hypothetical protein